MTDFELGQKVRYTNTLHRVSGILRTRAQRYNRVERRKEWAPYRWADNEAFRGNPLYNGVGIVTALRTLSNGTADYSGDVTSYKAEETFPAVEITYHLRRKPVLCRLEDVWPEVNPIPAGVYTEEAGTGHKFPIVIYTPGNTEQEQDALNAASMMRAMGLIAHTAGFHA